MSAEADGMPPQEAQAKAERYSVQNRIAVGTAGIVYQGLDTSTQKKVILKLLLPRSSHPMDVGKLLELLPTLYTVQHENIARLTDAYEEKDEEDEYAEPSFVLVYEDFAGTPGNLLPQERVLYRNEARNVAAGLLEALHAAEQLQVPHGDLKPSNVLISGMDAGELRLQVQDWGLSPAREELPDETLCFMSPQRLHGEPASPSSDLFSLGGVLYFLLTGARPVEGYTREEVLLAWQGFDPATLDLYRPDLDEELRAWVKSLLGLEPGARPASAEQAWQSLPGELQETTETADGPRPQPPRAPRPTAPRPAARPQPAHQPTVKIMKAGGQQASVPVPASASAPLPAPAPPPKEAIPLEARVMQIVFFLCIAAGAVVLFVWWAQNRWGPDWMQELGL